MGVCTVSRTALAGLVAGAAVMSSTEGYAQESQPLPPITVTDSRVGNGITGASSTVITKEEIERSPQQTLPDLLAREAGIQISTLYGGPNGSGTTVDVRGFGVTGPSNTLILINGRRLNDWDLPGFDLAAIAKNSIERIEITRGNSGAVLYGDGAVGGVINIVTKNGVGLAPSARIEAGYGSFRTKQGSMSANTSSGPFSASIYGEGLITDGYRDNNSLHQRNAVGDFRYTGDQGSVFFNIGADDQRARLPGERHIDVLAGIDQYATDRRGTNTPLNYGDKQGVRLTGGFTRTLAPGIEVIVDGGIRRKDQQAGFFQQFGEQYVDTVLTTSSFTPRVNIDRNIFDLPTKIIAGIDVYDTRYKSDRSFAQGLPLIHQFTGSQTSAAGYWQQTVSILPTTDLSAGARFQYNFTSLRDIYDPTAPQNASFPQGGPLDRGETNHALHAGIEHRFGNAFSVFGRAAQSFRVPNVDERIGNGAIVFPLPAPTFDLKTQTSEDFEAGVKLRIGSLFVQSSVYQMNLTNELHLNPVTFANSNLDPTRRRGVETIASFDLTSDVRLKGNLTYTQAKFRDGPFAGNDVPVVSRWTGSAGVTWDIVKKSLVFHGNVRFASDRFLDSDEFNRGTLKIPAVTLVDVRIGGEIDKFFWSVSVQNLFDVQYFDYGIDGSFTFLGTTFLNYNVYPLPGRTYLVKAGMNF